MLDFFDNFVVSFEVMVKTFFVTGCCLTTQSQSSKSRRPTKSTIDNTFNDNNDGVVEILQRSAQRRPELLLGANVKAEKSGRRSI